MKNYIFVTICFVFLLFAADSCREKTEDMSNYYTNKLQLSKESYTEQFKLIWTYLDQNYTLWDYESSYGLNWDQIYEEYLPKFKELDSRAVEVSDNEIEQLYTELLGQLHDGHIQLRIWNNNHRGLFPIYITPQKIRNKKSRSDFNVPQTTIESLDYYADQMRKIDGNETEYWCQFIDKILYYHIQDNLISPLNEQKVWMDFYAQIVKLQINGELRGIIIDLRNMTGGGSKNFHYLLGSLSPINLKDGFHRSGWIRVKTGFGRYDYSPKMMNLYPVDSEYQMNITTIPIVILSNCFTGSLGERVCYAAKQLDNGCVIGMKTWGGLSPQTILSDSLKVINHDAILGDEYGRNGNVYLTIQNGAWFTDDGEILEGKGVTPDIEVQLDVEAYKSTGRDTQLERALEYIRTGK